MLVELIKAIAWPVAAIWLGYLFKGELGKLLSRLSNLKYKDLEAKFDETLKAVEMQVELQHPLNQQDSTLENPIILSKLEQLTRIAEISPRAAIMEAWTMVETAAMSAGFVSGTSVRRVLTPHLMDLLVSSGDISKDSAALISNLRQLRNQAAHLPDFALTQAEAERYLEIAARCASLLEARTNVS